MEPIDKEEIISVQSDTEFQLENMFDYENILVHLDNLDENVQIELLNLNPLNILYFKNQSQDIKKIAIDYCNDESIEYIEKCMIFDEELYKLYVDKCKELNYDKFNDLNTINNTFETNKPKLVVSEVDENDQKIKYPFDVPNNQKISYINSNPFSLIRIHNPSKELCELAINNCRKLLKLNRVMFNVDLNKFPNLYLHYIQRSKETIDE